MSKNKAWAALLRRLRALLGIFLLAGALPHAPSAAAAAALATAALKPVVAISAGERHTCALDQAGAITCWGANEDGQASRPDTPGPYVEISAGTNHTCALLATGSVVCWGDNDFGQLKQPGGRFSSIDAGSTHTCGIRPNGTIVCWGDDRYGQLEPPSDSYKMVSAGSFHTCAVNINTELACWGLNSFGQADPPAGGFKSVSAGADHTCALSDLGELSCWGRSDGNRTAAPAGVYRALSIGTSHGCAQNPNSSISCWGLNSFGQAPPPNLMLQSFSAGHKHSCGVLIGGNVRCWGDDSFGQASVPGDNSSEPAAEPIAVTNLQPAQLGQPYSQQVVSAINPADYQLIGVLPEGLNYSGLAIVGTPKVAGNFRINAYLLGQKGYKMYLFYRLVIFEPGLLQQIAAGPDYTCTVRSNGKLHCWGLASADLLDVAEFITQISAGGYLCAITTEKRLGCGSTKEGSLPFFQVPFDLFFEAVSAGGRHVCALRDDGSILCWGDNSQGQASPPPGSFRALSAGGQHSCALRDDGGILCWGDNSQGQASPPPGSFRALSAGGQHSCALSDDGSILCWGDNSQGQASPPPGSFRALSAGGQHSCALSDDGSARCWGSDRERQHNSLVLEPAIIPTGTLGVRYTTTFSVSGGFEPYELTLEGVLPAGLSFSGRTIAGEPTLPGDFPLILRASDRRGMSHQVKLNLRIVDPSVPNAPNRKQIRFPIILTSLRR